MKKLLIFICFIPYLAYGQVPSDSLAKNYKLNFALPDFPAFKALGTEPSNILRPSNTEDFGFVSSEFFNGGNLVIPESFALEVSPALLMSGGRMTLKEYRENNAWKTARFSIGSQRDSLNASKVALGYRITLINKGDLRKDTSDAYMGKIAKSLEKLTALKSDARAAYLKEHNITAAEYFDNPGCIDMLIAEYVKEKEASIEKEIESIKEAYMEDMWNAKKFDVAVALVGASPDTLFKNVQYNSFSFWSTYATPIFKKRGQLLLGLYYQHYSQDEQDFSTISLSSRKYIGSNRLKVFLEEQLAYEQENDKLNLLLNLGAELNLRQGLWIDFNAGYTRDMNNNRSDFVSQFRFRYTILGKK